MSFFATPKPGQRPPSVPRAFGLVAVGARVRAAGRQRRAGRHGRRSRPKDVQILNTALGAELEAIAAYQVGAQSNLLQKPALDLALTFQGHQQGTRRAAGQDGREARRQGGGRKGELRLSGGAAEVAGRRAALRRQARARRRQRVSRCGCRCLPTAICRKAAASILGDEAMHWAVLRQVLGEAPVPTAFVS